MKRFISTLALIVSSAAIAWAEDKIEVFPSVSYDQYTIYQNLAIFWMFIIGLIVIIRMKLREIERIQKMGIDKTEKDIPLLD
ncbi:MAG: hypothetical protein NTX75_09935 [Proteobacteria bacterium]|nr:hypothetical protein [Pseudomonadota bacterium]